MSLPIVWLQPAEVELKEVVLQYEALRAGLGTKILDEVRSIALRLHSFPESSQRYSNVLRVAVLFSIPYQIYYAVRADDIMVTGVVPSRMDPKRRLRLLQARLTH